MELLYSRHFERRSVPRLEEARAAFGESLRAFREIYILIDGLDELADQLEPFLNLLGSLVKSFENLKTLATSRLASVLMRHPTFHYGHISLESSRADRDLQLFIRAELQSGQLKRLLDDSDLRQRVEENILKNANGMYV